MGSVISCIVVRSDHLPKRTPKQGETVQVEGRTGLFVVMNVDSERRMAQLMEKSGKHRLQDVPFEAIRTFNRNLARTINRFLDSSASAKTRKK